MEGARQREHRVRQEIEARNREPMSARGWMLLLACILSAPLLFVIALAPELLIAPFK